MRTLRTIALAGLLSATGMAGQAEAGQYQLHSCRLPDGAPTALVDWVPNGGTDGRYVRGDWCKSHGYFDVRMLAGAAQTGEAGRHWLLALPPAIRVRRVRGHFAATTRPGGHVIDAIAGNGLGNLSLGFGSDRGNLVRWSDPANAFDTGVITAAHTYLFGARCASGAVCAPLAGEEPKAYLRVFRAQATLEDLSIPTISSLAGRLIGPGVHRGIEGFALDASDAGAGVYRLIVELDGVERLTEVLDPGAGQCADQVPGNDTDFDFGTATPCLPRVTGGKTLDTRLLPDGEHTLRLFVEDAAGNRRLAFGPVDGWFVDNRPPRAVQAPGPPVRKAPTAIANGVPATERSRMDLFFVVDRTRRTCRWQLDRGGRTRRRCTRVRTGRSIRRGAVLGTPYGRRVRLTGRLMTLDGRPITGAQIHLRRLRRGARRSLERFDVRTDASGRFRTTLGRSPSERIQGVYYATSATRSPVLSRALVRRVPAGIAIRVVRRGRGAVLRGRLYGGSRPRSGVRVRAELRRRGHWVAFAERRVRGHASFTASLRLRGPVSRRMRFRVLRSAGYPYEPSVSREVLVRVRR